MRALLFLLCVLASGLVSAQSQEQGEATESPPPPSPSRAPAGIDIDALEPAVDGSRRIDATPRSTEAAAQGTSARVMDSLDLGTTSITGNQELPKVLYIVPWKRSDLGDLIGRPVNTLLNEVLAPIDPVVFERHLSYYDTLYGESEQE
jgi:hypothetical protein